MLPKWPSCIYLKGPFPREQKVAQPLIAYRRGQPHNSTVAKETRKIRTV